MEIETVAVFSEADRGAFFTTLGTQAYCIGGAHPSESYLNQTAIITAAHYTGCDAIHPGFGFLSENAEFARLVTENDLHFIGPPARCIEKLGDKNAARELMRKQGVPVVPGSDGLVRDVQAARTCAALLGYPVLIKASAGGGGKGMRVAEDENQLEAAFREASAEAYSCFGNEAVYLEKMIRKPRHIEFQILADNHGNIIHLGDRDCSLQRNHQKVLEEAPASFLDDKIRRAMGEAALEVARAVGYVNAGTVEFVVDEAGAFYFIEMNTRLQVEHPITEMITGIDIVREQIRVASGEPLSYKQADISFRGHAIECRINAEDPTKGFAPSPGIINELHLPSGFGIRVDSALHSGYLVSPFYDSMIAKIIVLGRTRDEAIARMKRALEETIVSGVTTNLILHYLLMYDPDYLSNRTDTTYIERNIERLLQSVEKDTLL
jgi:acetyl-CoA carboxylase biotin carboxylase subunit